MKTAQRLSALSAAVLALALSSAPAFAQASGAVPERFRWLTFAVFGVIIAITMFVTYRAAKRVKSTQEFMLPAARFRASRTAGPSRATTSPRPPS